MRRVSYTLATTLCFGALLGLPRQAPASDIISFLDGSDPVGGLSYEWGVQMDGKDHAVVQNFVGAKSWKEPTNPEGLKGWTHTSNWVMLELLEPSVLTIHLQRKKNVPTNSGSARNKLYPAFSFYAGWDNDGDEDHQFNTLGNTPWADGIDYISHEANDDGTGTTTMKLILPAGQYSLAVGGNPPALPSVADYPPGNCAPSTDKTCYTYTGQHGYRLELFTKPAPGLSCTQPGE